MAFDVVPSVSDQDRLVLEQALETLSDDGVGSDLRASSSWWRAAAQEAVGLRDGDDAASGPYAPSPRNTRGATRA